MTVRRDISPEKYAQCPNRGRRIKGKTTPQERFLTQEYFGCSHIYFGTNRIPESRRRDSGTYNRPMMRIEFDLFTDALSTPVHP